MDKLDLNLLRSLHALLKASNVTEAARTLGLSQSALSYNLARLRSELGDEILTRQGGQMVMTPYARDLQAPLAQILADIDRLVSRDDNLDLAHADMTFTIALPDVAEAEIAPAILAEVRRQAPNVRVDFCPIGSLNIQDALDAGQIHLAIGSYLTGRTHHKRRLLFHESFLSVFNPALIRPDQVTDSDQWLALPHVVVQETSGEPDPIHLALGTRGYSQRIAATSSRILVVPMLLQEAPLVATLPASLALGFAEAYHLQTAKPPLDLPALPIQLLWHQSFDRNPLHQWLRSIIRQSFKSRPA